MLPLLGRGTEGTRQNFGCSDSPAPRGNSLSGEMGPCLPCLPAPRSRTAPHARGVEVRLAPCAVECYGPGDRLLSPLLSASDVSI